MWEMERRQSTAQLREAAEAELGVHEAEQRPREEAPLLRPLLTTERGLTHYKPSMGPPWLSDHLGKMQSTPQVLFCVAPVISEGSSLHTPNPLQVTLNEGGELKFGFIF